MSKCHDATTAGLRFVRQQWGMLTKNFMYGCYGNWNVYNPHNLSRHLVKTSVGKKTIGKKMAKYVTGFASKSKKPWPGDKRRKYFFHKICHQKPEKNVRKNLTPVFLTSGNRLFENKKNSNFLRIFLGYRWVRG